MLGKGASLGGYGIHPKQHQRTNNKPQNGNKRDNRLENLEVVTIAENIRHACDTGLRNDKGEANRKAKLADSDIIEIRRLTAEGIRSADIAKKFNVGILAIQRIRSGLRWSHVK